MNQKGGGYRAPPEDKADGRRGAAHHPTGALPALHTAHSSNDQVILRRAVRVRSVEPPLGEHIRPGRLHWRLLRHGPVLAVLGLEDEVAEAGVDAKDDDD